LRCPFSEERDLSALSSGTRSVQELRGELDRLLDPVLSARRTAEPLAAGLASLDRAQQELAMHWATVVARTNIELAFQFVLAAPQALSRLNAAQAEEWLVEVLDVYDREGLHRATELLTQQPLARTEAAAGAVKLTDIAHVLQLFVNALSGRRMRIETASRPYTDTEVLYLPPSIARAATTEDNFFLYKATVVLLWAQTRFGTFRADLEHACAQFSDPEKALALLSRLETLRLEARISPILPGLARGMAALRANTPLDRRWAALLDDSATVHTSLTILCAVYDSDMAIDDPYEIVLEPRRAAATRASRMSREKAELRSALGQLGEQAITSERGDETRRYSFQAVEPSAANGTSFHYALRQDGKPVEVAPELARLMDSVLQDLGTIPDDYLLPSRGSDAEAPNAANTVVDPGAERHGDPAFFYDEWDYIRHHYRKNWCVVRERESSPGDGGFVPATLAKYSGTVRQLRRTFELMRTDDRVLKRQPDGDDIDLDALLDAHTDMEAGAELGTLLFTRRRKHERDLAVMFMVDMSGSTKGWVNEAEREALVMLCEALEVLGDRYAIYGFSGMTRKGCEIFRIKRFDERYGSLVHQRIAGIKPQDYTRMGAAIRHLSTVLGEVQAQTKLLVTLSDGKPDDYSDEYRGDYGIEDTRHALLESHRSGIKAFCITIDSEAREYLPHMYGAANWTLVDDVTRLPLKVAEIYRRLTH
jgi:nitric oxide reductase NorD protein